jgi:hypothetical protein
VWKSIIQYEKTALRRAAAYPNISPRGRKPLHCKQNAGVEIRADDVRLKINDLIIYLRCVESSLILHQNPSTARHYFCMPLVAKWRFREIRSQPGGDSESVFFFGYSLRPSDTKGGAKTNLFNQYSLVEWNYAPE